MRSTLTLFLVLAVFCAGVSATTITSTFECKSTENDSATMTYYNYIEEPKLEKCGYTEGYKTGTLVYLENGDIDFEDYVSYYDGLKDATHNEPFINYSSALQRKQTIDFIGDKAIAKIYAKGYFPNHRALSAWKKIRYTEMWYDVTKVNYTNGFAYPNDDYRVGHEYRPMDIKATTDVGMGPINETGRPADYYFDYNAEVKNGALEIWDSTGWTNETCGKKVDWEQTALVKGNFTAVNRLVAEGVFIPAAGEDDWLSCCIGGNPPIVPSCPGDGCPSCPEGNCSIGKTSGYWPNSGIYATLDPDIILPNKKMQPIKLGLSNEYGRYSINFTRNMPEVRDYEPCNTTETKCTEGYECVYTEGDGLFTYSAGEIESGAGPEIDGQKVGPGIEVFKEVDNFDPQNNMVKYVIWIHNDGRATLEDVKIVDILPDYFELNYSQIYDNEISTNVDYLLNKYGKAEVSQLPKEALDAVIHGWPPNGSGIEATKDPRLTESGIDTAFNLTWELDRPLRDGEIVYIYLDAKITNITALGSVHENKVIAEGIFVDTSGRRKVISEATATKIR